MNAKQIQDRFDELRSKRVFKSARWLSDSMKINRHSINKILTGDINTERDRILFRAILEQIGMDENSFYGRAPVQPQKIDSDVVPLEKVPLWGEIPAGNPTSVTGTQQPEEMIAPPPGVRPKNLFALRVSGRSMYPRLIPGDIVYL